MLAVPGSKNQRKSDLKNFFVSSILVVTVSYFKGAFIT